MGLFGSGDKNSSISNAQTGASDDALLVAAGGSGARDGGVSLTTGFLSTNKFGTTEVSGTNNTLNQGFDAASVSSLLDKTTNSLGDLVKTQTQASLEAIAGLAETKQTDGANKTTQAGLWIALAALAGLVWVLSKVFGSK